MNTPRTDAAKFRHCANWNNQGDHVREIVFAEDMETLETELTQAQADAAAMRAFLEQASDTANFASSGPFFFASALIQQARNIVASTTAGADILAERDSLRAEVERLREDKESLSLQVASLESLCKTLKEQNNP